MLSNKGPLFIAKYVGDVCVIKSNVQAFDNG
jgi:hypothetical protein